MSGTGYRLQRESLVVEVLQHGLSNYKLQKPKTTVGFHNIMVPPHFAGGE